MISNLTSMMIFIFLMVVVLDPSHLLLKTSDLRINNSANFRMTMKYRLMSMFDIAPVFEDNSSIGLHRVQLQEGFKLRLDKDNHELHHAQLEEQIPLLDKLDDITDVIKGVHREETPKGGRKDKDYSGKVFLNASTKDSEEFKEQSNSSSKKPRKDTEGIRTGGFKTKFMNFHRSSNELAHKGNNPSAIANVWPRINSNYFTEIRSHIGNFIWKLLLIYGILIATIKFGNGPFILLMLIGCLCAPVVCQLSNYAINEYYYDSAKDFVPSKITVGSDGYYLVSSWSGYTYIIKVYTNYIMAWKNSYSSSGDNGATVITGDYLVIVNYQNNYDSILIYSPDGTLFTSFTIPQLTISGLGSTTSAKGYGVVKMDNGNFAVIGKVVCATINYPAVMEMTTSGTVPNVYTTSSYGSLYYFKGRVYTSGYVVAATSDNPAYVYIIDTSSGLSLKTNYTLAGGLYGICGSGSYIYLAGMYNSKVRIWRYNIGSNSIDITKDFTSTNGATEYGAAIAYNSGSSVAILACKYASYNPLRVIITDDSVSANIVQNYLYPTSIRLFTDGLGLSGIFFLSPTKIMFMAGYQNTYWKTYLVEVNYGCFTGYYVTGNSCTICNAGTFSSSINSTSCSSCDAGTYSAAGASSCTPCGAGTYNPNSDQSNCTQCSPGYYNPNNGSISSSACVQCEAGKFSGSSGASFCSTCSTGTFSLAGASSCTSCSAGTYQNLTGQASCINCPAGYYASSTNSVTCTICPAGKYQDVEGSSNYKPCPAGTFGNTTGLTSCYNCTPGKYRSNTGQQSCLDVPAGYYTNVEAATSYTPCAIGYYQPNAGSTSCIACEAGKIAANTGRTSCTICSQGYYAPVASSVCTLCPVGTFGNTTLLASCYDCPTGTIAPNQGSTSCTNCTSGYYAPATKSTVCLACGPGKFSNSSASSGCYSCEIGYNTSANSATSCSPCPVGTFTNSTGTATCISCPAGTSQNNTGSTECTLCSQGYYSAVKAATCTACPNGTYQGNTGSSSCIPCEAGSFASVNGSSICTSCAKGYYSAGNASSCTPCGVGTYQDTTGSTSCKSCSAGTYANVTGSQSCTPCPKGNYSSAGASSCLPCNVGFYQDLTGSLSCKNCPVGTFQNSTGKDSCINCSVGFYQDQTTQTSCKSCSQGYYSDDIGKSNCTACSSGYYQNLTAQTSCIKCPIGTYSTALGGNSCVPCSGGTANNVEGLSTACPVCLPGTYSTAGQASCVACNPGYYQPSSSATICIPCPAGKNQSVSGKEICGDCPVGYYQDQTTQASCKACEVGKYQGSEGKTSCIPCSAGSYQNLTAQVSCVLCPVGTYQTLAEQTSCNPCPAGSSSNVSGLITACPVCLPGTYQPSTGKTSCINCDPGFFQVSSSALDCTFCPKGKYQPLSGKISCLDCASGYYQNQTGKDSCIACPVGFYVNGQGNTDCTPCPVGTSQDKEGQSSCTPCSLGYYQNLIQQASCIQCPTGSDTIGTGSLECKCMDGWKLSYAQNKCLYKGLFETISNFQNHDFSRNCFSGASIIKPFSFECRKSFMPICCNDSTIIPTVSCNFALELQSGDKEYDSYCKPCLFSNITACPPSTVCWNDVVDTLQTNYTLSCLEFIAPYCGSRLMLNPNNTECAFYTNSCNSVILNSTYGSNFEKFTISFSRRLPTIIPSYNSLFDLAKSPSLIPGKFDCLRTSDYTIDVNISALPMPVLSYYLADSVLKDACGVYVPSAAVQKVTPPNNLGVVQIEGSTPDKCMGLTINSTIRKDYGRSITALYWNIEYLVSYDVPTETVNRIKYLGSPNKTTVSFADYDLYPSRTLKISLTAVTPYGANITSNELSIVVPGIASGKKYCGPCQLDDRSSCKNYNYACWESYLDSTVLIPFNTTTCLKAMAKKCYEIWTTSKLSTNDLQCLDFVQYYNFTAMKFKPSLTGAFYSSDGKTITLTFDNPIYISDFVDCSALFSSNTLKWFPDSKSGKWLNKITFQVDYEPKVGIMKTLTLLGNVLHNEYVYSQEFVSETTMSIVLPRLETVLAITGITTVSECDSIELYAVLVTSSLFKLVFKWEISYDYSTLDSNTQESLRSLLNKYSEYSYQNVLILPSQYLVRGTTVKVNLIAKVGEYESNSVSASTEVNIVGEAVVIKFASKSQKTLDIEGSVNSKLSFDVLNKRCAKSNPDTNTNARTIPVSIEFQVASGKSSAETTTITEEESKIAAGINKNYQEYKILMVGNSFGFKYLKYYSIKATVQDLLTGAKHDDTLEIRLTKPAITSVIDPIGTLVSTSADIELNGGNSIIPVSTDDVIEYKWRCAKAISISLGGSCSCPYLNDDDMLNPKLIISKRLIKGLCRYTFSLTISATIGDFKRTSRSSIEFLTYPGTTLALKDVKMKGSDEKIVDVYFSFTLPQSENAPKDSDIPFQWSLLEVISENPSVSTYYTIKNTFIYDFFLKRLEIQLDPQMIKSDTQIPTELNPSYLTPMNVRVLGVDRNSLLEHHRYVFGVIVLYPNSPTFVFTEYLAPPLPRKRDISISSTSGVGFDTEFKVMFNLPVSTDVDEAKYQILRRDCPSNNTEMTIVTQQLSRVNSQTMALSPGLKSCNYQVEIIVRAYEYDSKTDISTIITVEEPKMTASKIIKEQLSVFNGNNSLTMEQKLIVLNQVSSLQVTESTKQGKEDAKFIFDQLSLMDNLNLNGNKSAVQMMDIKDKISFVSAGTTIIALLASKQKVNIDINLTTAMKDKIDNYVDILQNCKGDSSVISSMVSALSEIAVIGIKEECNATFFTSLSNVTSKIINIMLENMPVGGPPRIIESHEINIVCKKSYVSDFDNNQTYNTSNRASITLPGNLQTQMISNLRNQLNNNSTSAFKNIENSTINIGASLRATSFNTLNPIKSNTHIDVDSITNSSSPIVYPDTIQKIYTDFGKGKYEDLVDLKGLESNLLKLTFAPFIFLKNATETPLKASVSIGLLKGNVTAEFAIPSKLPTSNYVNTTVMVPLYYMPDDNSWTNKNCTLSNPDKNDTVFHVMCYQVGSEIIQAIDAAVDFTVDVISDVFKVVAAGNYQELSRVQSLSGIGTRNFIAFGVILGIIILVVYAEIILTSRDKHDLYEIKYRALLDRFNKEQSIPCAGVLNKILGFMIQARRTGIKKAHKQLSSIVHAEHARVIKKLKKVKKSKDNGVAILSEEEEQSLKDLHDLIIQCSMIYSDEEIEEILSPEFNEHPILHRVTKNYIDEEITKRPIGLWSLIKVILMSIIYSMNIPSSVHSQGRK